MRGVVTEPGSYSFILHYYQPNKPSFEAEALIQDGQFYSGTAKIEHCPNVAGCRVALHHRDSNSSFFDIQKNFLITLRTPQNSEVYFDYLLVVPSFSYKDQLLSLASTDVGTNLMSDCLQNNFYIESESANGKLSSIKWNTFIKLPFSHLCRSMSFSHLLDHCRL